MVLVTLAQAKAHLRLIEDDEDTYVEGLIAAATEHIETVCGPEFEEASSAQHYAALLMIGQWFDNRDEAVIPPAANALLRPFMLAF
nr:head-tail connector protein [Brevundimonas diminuta]